MKKARIPLVALFGVLLALPALAMDLQSARAQGLVGEKADGYVAAIASTGEVKALVADVNAKRKAKYAQISKENGQSVDVVAKIAAPGIISGLPAGALYQGEDGGWEKR